MASPSRNSKCAVACGYCRLKKIKCDAGQPCGNCVRQRTQCHFASLTRRTRRTAAEINRQLRERLDCTEALLEAVVTRSSIDNCDTINQYQNSRPLADRQDASRTYVTDVEDRGLQRRSPFSQSAYDMHDTGVVHHAVETNQAHNHARTRIPGHETEQHTGTTLLPESFSISPKTPSFVSNAVDQSAVPQFPQYEGSVTNDERTQLQTPDLTSPYLNEEEEIQGSGSYLSICSDDAIDWVTERIGSPGFSSSANLLSSSVTRSLKLHGRLSQVRTAEPDPETAWNYTKAYFEGSLNAALNTIHRETFETRLRLSMEFGAAVDNDPAWYALRNAVYAVGSRIVIHESSPNGNWVEAHTQSWRFLENALSVHTELAYCSSDVTAAQALLAMAYYVEGASSPKLEYMLVSTALRLALSKGLHLKPARSWNLSESEINNRNWLFWSIYFFEKMIALRSGRPSAIDDDDISCQIPTMSPEGNTARAEVFRRVVFHGQISSSVIKKLTTAKARQQSASKTIKTVKSLDNRLREWWADIPSELRPGSCLKISGLPTGIQVEHLAFLFLAYHGTLATIHSMLAWPWNIPGLEKGADETICEQIDASRTIIADSSRNIILAMKSINVNAEAPGWLVFYFPMVGMINLFLYILQFPTLESVSGDIGLLDAVAGFFGYLEFASSSQISLPVARDITNWARAAVAKAREIVELNASPIDALPPAGKTGIVAPDINFSHEFGNLSEANIWLDPWSRFGPSFADVSSAGLSGLFGAPEQTYTSLLEGEFVGG